MVVHAQKTAKEAQYFVFSTIQTRIQNKANSLIFNKLRKSVN